MTKTQPFKLFCLYTLLLLITSTVFAYNVPLLVCEDHVDLSLTIKANEELAEVGEKIGFSVSIINHSEIDATGVGVLTQIPSGYGRLSCSSYNPEVREKSIQWKSMTVPAKSTLTIVFHAEVLAQGDWKALAEISHIDQKDINSIPNNGADNDGDGRVGSYDDDGNQDFDDEDDGDDASIVLKTSQVSSIEESEKKTSVHVYPNPSSDMLNIEVSKTVSASVQITMYSRMGNVVDASFLSEKGGVSQFDQQVDISHLPSGKYVLNIKIGDSSFIKKVVVGN